MKRDICVVDMLNHSRIGGMVMKTGGMALIFGAVLLTGLTADAANVNWNKFGDGNWYESTNYWTTGGTTPILAFPVLIDNVKHNYNTAVITVDSNVVCNSYESTKGVAGGPNIGNPPTLKVVAGGYMKTTLQARLAVFGTGTTGKILVDGGILDIGGAMEFPWKSIEGTGTVHLASGSIAVKGPVRSGYSDKTNGVGTLIIDGGTLYCTNGYGSIEIGGTSPGSMFMNAGEVVSPIKSLLIGVGPANGLVTQTNGTMLLRGLAMNTESSVQGTATLNLLGGELTIKPNTNISTVAVSTGSSIVFDKGIFRWQGDWVEEISTNWVDKGFVTWSGGRDAMLTTQWEASWTNGSSVLYADYNSASNGYTTVWALDMATVPTGYPSYSNQYGLVTGPDEDQDDDGLSNLAEYGLGGDPTNSANQGVSPTYLTQVQGGTNWFVYIHPQLSDPNSGLIYYLKTNTDLVFGQWTNANYEVAGIDVTGGALDFVTNRVSMASESKQFVKLVIEQE